MYEQISNREFIDRFQVDSLGAVVLSREIPVARQKLMEYEDRMHQLVSQKREVAEQSGDNWHDGAFKPTDDAAKILVEQIAKIKKALQATEVSEPDSDEDRATLGSRVKVSQNGEEYSMDIVGIPLLHESESEVTACSIESPIAKLIIGKCVGEVVILDLTSLPQQIEILGIDFGQKASTHEQAN